MKASFVTFACFPSGECPLKIISLLLFPSFSLAFSSFTPVKITQVSRLATFCRVQIYMPFFDELLIFKTTEGELHNIASPSFHLPSSRKSRPKLSFSSYLVWCSYLSRRDLDMQLTYSIAHCITQPRVFHVVFLQLTVKILCLSSSISTNSHILSTLVQVHILYKDVRSGVPFHITPIQLNTNNYQKSLKSVTIICPQEKKTVPFEK